MLIWSTLPYECHFSCNQRPILVPFSFSVIIFVVRLSFCHCAPSYSDAVNDKLRLGEMERHHLPTVASPHFLADKCMKTDALIHEGTWSESRVCERARCVWKSRSFIFWSGSIFFFYWLNIKAKAINRIGAPSSYAFSYAWPFLSFKLKMYYKKRHGNLKYVFMLLIYCKLFECQTYNHHPAANT